MRGVCSVGWVSGDCRGIFKAACSFQRFIFSEILGLLSVPPHMVFGLLYRWLRSSVRFCMVSLRIIILMKLRFTTLLFLGPTCYAKPLNDGRHDKEDLSEEKK